MGYEPITCCRYCGEPFDAYVAIEDRVCDSCKETTPDLERNRISMSYEEYLKRREAARGLENDIKTQLRLTKKGNFKPQQKRWSEE